MKSFRSYKYRYDRQFSQSHNWRPLVGLASLLLLVSFSFLVANSQGGPLADASTLSYRHRRPLIFFEHRFQTYKGPGWSKGNHSNGHKDDSMVDPSDDSTDTVNTPGTNSGGTPQAPVTGQVHTNISTTYFWVGESSGPENGYIPNNASTWDEQWQAHFGGVDSPTGRNGYLPGGFTPKENPFYFALPYSDFNDNGQRKASGSACANAGNPALAHYSWCKNTWIAISHSGKTVYAQWEDAGPFGEDDTVYVFGTAQPHNTQNSRAGLDVSPAVHDYLGLGDVDKTNWWFIPASSVPAGPWTQIITTTKGDSL